MTTTHPSDRGSGQPGKPPSTRQLEQADERCTEEIEPLSGSIDIPVLVAWGAEDTRIPVDRGRTLAQAIPGSDLHVVPDAGHLIQLDAPETRTTILLDWLASVG